MKARKMIYLILAGVFIVFDLLVTFVTRTDLMNHFKSDAYDIGYVVGSQFLLYAAIGLIYGAYRVQRKINQKERETLLGTIDEIGNAKKI
jgi:hypothetical protein